LLKYFSQGAKEDMDVYWKKEEEQTSVNQEKKNFKKKQLIWKRSCISMSLHMFASKEREIG
jgi:hypothetical protein